MPNGGYGNNGYGNMMPQQISYGNNGMNGFINNGGGYGGNMQMMQQQQQQPAQQKIAVSRDAGEYSSHDILISSNTISFITWLGQRVIGAVHGGFFYFGSEAIKLLESQISFMYTTEATNKNPSYSLGIVPHGHSSSYSITQHSYVKSFLNRQSNQQFPKTSDLMITGKDCEVIHNRDSAVKYTFNFIIANVFPAVIKHDGITGGYINDEASRQTESIFNEKIVDMFAVADDYAYNENGQPTASNEDVLNKAKQRADTFCSLMDNRNANDDFAGGLFYMFDPFNPDAENNIYTCIERLVSEQFIVIEGWEPTWKIKYRSWDDHPRGWFMQTQRQYTNKNVITYEQGMNKSAAAASNIKAPQQASFSFGVSKRSQGNAYQQSAKPRGGWNRPQQQQRQQQFFNNNNANEPESTTDFEEGAL